MRAKDSGINSRSAAVQALKAVCVDRRSLSSAKSVIDDSSLLPRQRAQAMELVNGVLRWRVRLEALLAKLLKKPLRRKDTDLQLVLLVALYEINALSTPDYAIVNEAVNQVRRIGKPWASAMVNAVLRRYIRDKQSLAIMVDQDPVARFAHPQWLIDRVQQDWPEQVEQILMANNQRPPMWLRVNKRKLSVADYLRRLQQQKAGAVRHRVAAVALKLDRPMDVSQLPGFDQGLVSVQDAAAQLAAQLLAPQDDDLVLDLCAAPGGKTCHLLEFAAGIEMTAVDIDPARLKKVRQNLERLNLQARLIVGDATDVQSWAEPQHSFDRILVDAPCSASGVIRRHPDIKSLRQPDDLLALASVQQKILQQAWTLLRPGGQLLYVTCSVFRMENEQQIDWLLSAQSDAESMAIDQDWGISCRHGRQLLPGVEDGDGFYFALLKKRRKAP